MPALRTWILFRDQSEEYWGGGLTGKLDSGLRSSGGTDVWAFQLVRRTELRCIRTGSKVGSAIGNSQLLAI